MEEALREITGQGLVGAFLVIALMAIGFLYRRNQQLHDQMREDGREQTRALLTAAAASDSNTTAIKENTAVLRQLITKGGLS